MNTPRDRPTDPVPPMPPPKELEWFERLAHRLDELHGRLDKLDAICDETSGLSRGIHDINGHLGAINYELEGLREAVQTVANRTAEVHQEHASIRRSIDRIKGRLLLLENEQDPPPSMPR